MFVVLRPDYKISLVNQKVCDILGYPAEELLDQNWLTFLGSPKDRKRLKLLFDRTLKGKSKLSDSFETYVLSQKGEKRLIRWQNALLKDADGMNTGLVCSGEDISAKRGPEPGHTGSHPGRHPFARSKWEGPQRSGIKPHRGDLQSRKAGRPDRYGGISRRDRPPDAPKDPGILSQGAINNP